MGISSSDAQILAQALCAEQRLRVASVENSNGFQILRFAGSNGATIGSLTIAPALLELSEAEAILHIKAQLLDACKAAAREPINRVNAPQVSDGKAQKEQKEQGVLAKQEPLGAPSVNPGGEEPKGGELP